MAGAIRVPLSIDMGSPSIDIAAQWLQDGAVSHFRLVGQLDGSAEACAAAIHRKGQLAYEDFGNGVELDLSGQMFLSRLQPFAAALAVDQRLTSLRLAEDSLGDEAVRWLSECLVQNAFLRALDLEGNEISCIGAAMLASIVKGPASGLSKLRLGRNRISDNGALSLVKAAIDAGDGNDCSLTELDLSFNYISDKGAQSLTKLLHDDEGPQPSATSHRRKRRGLAKLMLTGNQVGSQTAEELEIAFLKGSLLQDFYPSNLIKASSSCSSTESLKDRFEHIYVNCSEAGVSITVDVPKGSDCRLPRRAARKLGGVLPRRTAMKDCLEVHVFQALSGNKLASLHVLRTDSMDAVYEAIRLATQACSEGPFQALLDDHPLPRHGTAGDAGLRDGCCVGILRRRLLLATASADGNARVWDASTGELVNQLEGHQAEVACVAFSPDGGTLVTASWDNTARLWDAESGESIRELKGHTKELTWAEFSADGSQVLTTSRDTTARFWDPKTGACLRILFIQEELNAATLSPSGQLLAVATMGADEWLWDAASGRSVTWLQGHLGTVTAVAFAPSGQEVATASEDGTTRIWSARGEERGEQDAFGRDGFCSLILRHRDAVTSVSYSSDGLMVVTGSEDGTVRIWSTETGECLRQLKGHDSEVNSVAFTGDGLSVLAACSNGRVWIWDAEASTCVNIIKAHLHRVMAAAFAPVI